jgi:hypothetical protein
MKVLVVGGGIGGPIHKDKLFFLAGFQGRRQAKFVTSTPSVPLPVFFTGDLSAYAAPIRDLQKTCASAASSSNSHKIPCDESTPL